MLLDILTRSTDGTVYIDGNGQGHAFTPLKVVSMLNRDNRTNRIVLSLYNFASSGDVVTVEYSPNGADCWTPCVNGSDGSVMAVTADRNIAFKQVDGYLRCNTPATNSQVKAILK